MPYKIEWEQHVVIGRFTGHVTSEDFTCSAVEMTESEEFDSLRYAIADFLDCTSESINGQSLDELVVMRLGSLFSNPNVRVIVLTKDDAIAGMIRSMQKEMGPDDQGTYVAKSMEEAKTLMDFLPPMHRTHLRPRFT